MGPAAAMPMPGGMPGQMTDQARVHQGERDTLELIAPHVQDDKKLRWLGDGIETRVLAMYA